MSPNEVPAENEFPELTPFEASLAALAPQPATIDRETFFFQAGQTAALRDRDDRRLSWTRWGWPAAFSAMTAVAATLLAMLCIGAKPTTAPPGIGTPPEIAAASAPFVLPERNPQQEDHLSGMVTYSRVRDEILRQGINARLPGTVASNEATVVAARPLSYYELLNQVLQE